MEEKDLEKTVVITPDEIKEEKHNCEHCDNCDDKKYVQTYTKKSNRFGRVLIIILLFVLGIVVGLSLSKTIEHYMNTKEVKEENEVKDVTSNENSKVENLSLEDKLVIDAESMIPREFCHGYKLSFPKKDRAVNELTNDEKISIVASYYHDKVENLPDPSDGVYRAEVKIEEIKKLFDDVSFLNSVSSVAKGVYGLQKINGKYYVFQLITGCGAESSLDDYLYLTKAVKEGNDLSLTFAYSYKKEIVDLPDDEYKTYLYKDKADKNYLVDASNIDDYDTIDWSKFNKYRFVIDTSNGNMKLKNIEYIEAK